MQAEVEGVSRWGDLVPPLSPCCLDAVTSLGFASMTPVQSGTIPYFRQNKDVAVEAVTGSGKTLAFVIPVVEILLMRKQNWKKTETGAIILSPTRELAVQTGAVLRHFLPETLSLSLLIGGQDVSADVKAINENGAQVVVATPGRLVDLLGRTQCSLASTVRSLEVLVLDEADRLLELGFEQSINTILSHLPKQRRTGLFSATMTQDVKALVRSGLRNPVTITVRDTGPSSTGLTRTPQSLHNYFMVCRPEEKLERLLTVLAQFSGQKVIVFFATCASVSYFATLTKRLLGSAEVLALHGRMHTQRQKLFDQFSSLESAVLMCTDVMARGVDFPCVDWVLQFDPPSSAKGFVHRCGRTARMGREGRAVVMLLPTETAYVDFLSLNQHISLLPFDEAPPTSRATPTDGATPTIETMPTDDVFSLARELAAREREIYELGMRAFVSFVHFYYKHESKLIFRARELDLVGLARGFSLLHLPRMPELKAADLQPYPTHPVDPASIPYKDKAREKQRQAKMAIPVEERRAVAAQRRKMPTWKKLKKAEVKKRASGAKSERKRRRKREELSEGDLAELARDARLLKKFKSGKITKAQLEAQLDE